MKRLLFSSPWLGLALTVSGAVVLMGIVGDQGLMQVIQLRRQTHVVQQRTEDLAAENRRLKRRIWRYRNDASFTEHLAREQLGFVRDREVLFRFAL